MKTSEFTEKRSLLEISGQKDKKKLLILVDSKIRFHPKRNQCSVLKTIQSITNKNVFHNQRCNRLKRHMKMTCHYSLK